MFRVSLFLFSASVGIASCETVSPPSNPSRETLPNGAVLVRYPGLPAIDSVGPEVTEVQVDLQFGSRDGDDPNLAFGRIQGIQAASDGTIYVLDLGFPPAPGSRIRVRHGNLYTWVVDELDVQYVVRAPIS